MHLSAFLQFEPFTDCSIREYRSILVHYSETFTYYASIILWPIMLFIMLAYLTQAYWVLLYPIVNMYPHCKMTFREFHSL